MTTKVVILNWNGRHHLERFLPSVVATTPAGVEVVVADNGSDDGSLEFLAADYPSVGVVALDRNYGFAEGYNRALEHLDADYFILLNSDVEAVPGWCEPLVGLLDGDPRIAVAQPKILSYKDRTKFEYAGAAGGFMDCMGYPFCRGRILSTVETDTGQYDDVRDVFWASGACMIVRADVYRALGGLDARFFAHMEEIDFCWRAQLSGYRIAVQPAAVVLHLGGGTLSEGSERKIYFNFRNSLAMLFKNLPRGRGRAVVALRMALDGCSALVYLVQGKKHFYRAVIAAHRDFRSWLPALRGDRDRIQSAKVGKSREIYRGLILLRYLLGHRTFGGMMQGRDN